jgi:ABC-type lipoprotein release transport system permease subunit
VTAALPPELFGTSATYPQTFAMVVAALLVVAVAATYLPSRAAAGIDPQQALKSD